jgi:hypothetical protein
MNRYNVINLFGFAFPIFFYAQIKKAMLGVGSNEFHLWKAALAGLLGCLLCDVFVAMKYVYSHTAYVRDRLTYESQIGFDRNEVNEIYEEYPFTKDGIMATDVMIRNHLK